MKKQWNVNEHVWQCLFLTVLVHCYWKPTFSKLHSEKLCLRSPSDGCGRMAIPRKKRLGFQEIRTHPSEASNLLRPFYLLYLFWTSAVTPWGFFLKLSGQQRIFYVMDSWTEGIILEGIKLIQTIILAYRNTTGFNKSVVTGYVAL